MVDRKKLLIIKVSDDISEAEISIIKSVANMAQVDSFVVDLTTLKKIINEQGKICFDYIYLCGHGSVEGMGEATILAGSWDDIAKVVCASICIQPSAMIFLACCRGGLPNVADSFFEHCDSVGLVIGPIYNITPDTITLGFQTVMVNMLSRKSDPETACSAASDATGNIFAAHDRQQCLAKEALANKSLIHNTQQQSEVSAKPFIVSGMQPHLEQAA